MISRQDIRRASYIGPFLDSIVRKDITFFVLDDWTEIFTSSSSRSSFSSSKGFSSKLRSTLFCVCISLRVDCLRIFRPLKVSGSLKESFLRGLGVVSKPRGLLGPGLAGVDGSDEAIVVLLKEFLSMAYDCLSRPLRISTRSQPRALSSIAQSLACYIFFLFR